MAERQPEGLPGDGQGPGREPGREPDRHEETTEAEIVVDHDLVSQVLGAFEASDEDAVRDLVAPLHAADVADLLERLPGDERAGAVRVLKRRLQEDPEVLSYLDEAVLSHVIRELTPAELARAISELDSDDALGLIEGLDEDERRDVLARLTAETRQLVEEGLTFPEYSAGRLMQREFVAVPMFWTVGKTIDYLRQATDLPDNFYLIFAIDPMHKPAGAAPLSRILRSRRSVKIGDLISEEVRTVPASMDQEEVAYLFRQYGMVSAPVVDEAGRLIGVITVDDVVDVIDEEAEDDLLKLGGVREDDLYRAVLATARLRFTWLAVNLCTAFLAASVIGAFEGTIQQLVALAVLMPIVASLGGNAGMQSVTVAVRGIAMKDLTRSNAARFIWKELLVGWLNGILFALITGGVAGLWFGNWLLGVVIGSAIVINLVIASVAGTGIPLLLDRLKVDPAVASSVFLTTVTDVIGFFAFLGLAALVLF